MQFFFLQYVSPLQKHEPDDTLRAQQCISFEGFALYMMSRQNLTFVSERIVPQEDELDHPMAHYYVAASHNTYLTGHQLKGESSVELYSQVSPQTKILKEFVFVQLISGHFSFLSRFSSLDADV